MDAPLRWLVRWVYPARFDTPLGLGPNTLGRGTDCSAVLQDREVSRHHATIHIAACSVRIVDHGSRNGVWVDGQERVSASALGDGSVVRVGSHVGVVVAATSQDSGCERLLSDVSPGTDTRAYLGSGKLASVVHRAETLAPMDAPIFVQGESGTGKEAIASLIHHRSGRRGSWVPVNCAAIRGDLAAAALFGHTRGAFSGAFQGSLGAVGAAAGGTLFLDEVAELSPTAQSLLLRFLEGGEVTPVGATRPRCVDARVVAATHRNLAELVQAGAFRGDLFYRLVAHVIHVPPLRRRREDIAALFTHYSARALGDMTPGFVARLLCYDWPGNVRELKNVASRLAPGCTTPGTLSGELLLRHFQSPDASRPIRRSLGQISKAEWIGLLREHNGVASQISKALGAGQSTIKRHLVKHGLR